MARKADTKRAERELERRYRRNDCAWECPACGADTADAGEDLYDSDTHYKERACTQCDLRLTIVYRMHYQYATSSDGNMDYQGETVNSPWRENSPLQVLVQALHGMHMQQYNYTGSEHPYDNLVDTLAAKVDITEWPKVLADGTYHEDIHKIAQRILGGADGAEKASQ